jgi:hypothetical protein
MSYRASTSAKPSEPRRRRLDLLLWSILALFAGPAWDARAQQSPGFYTVTPCRLVDTRNPSGPYGGPALTANADRWFTIVGRCGIPSTAEAVSLNVTVTRASSGGDIRLYAGGSPLPSASAINYDAQETRANNGLYALGAGGNLVARCDQAAGTVHLLLDVSGYLETASNPGGGGGSPWSKWYGGSGGDTGRGVAVDTSGNVVVAGQYQGVVNFGTGSFTSYTNPASGPTIDAFLAKYSSSGSPVWSKSLGGNSSDAANGVATDSSGNVVVTGYQASSTVDYGAGLLPNRGVTDIFLAKYSPTGGYLWAKTIGGTGADSGAATAVDSAGNVFATGNIDGTSGVDFGGGALFSAGAKDVFLVKYSPVGGHVWSKRFGGTGYDFGAAVAVDSAGNVVVAGTFDGTIDLGGGQLTTAGDRDIFVAKFSSTGQHIWSKRFGGSSADFVRGIAVSSAGDVLLTGHFLATINFGGPSLTSAGFEDIFLAKLSGSNGGHVWSQRFGSNSGPDFGYGVAVDGNGNVAMTGYFAGTVNFGGGGIAAQMYDIFVAKYTSAGSFLSARRYGDPANLYNNQYGYAIAMSGGGSMYVTGEFTGTLTFGAAGQGTSTAFGGNDAYLASVGP